MKTWFLLSFLNLLIFVPLSKGEAEERKETNTTSSKKSAVNSSLLKATFHKEDGKVTVILTNVSTEPVLVSLVAGLCAYQITYVDGSVEGWFSSMMGRTSFALLEPSMGSPAVTCHSFIKMTLPDRNANVVDTLELKIKLFTNEDVNNLQGISDFRNHTREIQLKAIKIP